MRARKLLVPLLGPLLGLMGCGGLPTGLASFAGTFSFLASDAGGRPAFGGTLDLAVHDDSTVTGGHTLVVYRISGSPSVVGRIHGDSIFLWLDPNPDAGIIVNARGFDGGFGGTWSYNTIGGPLPGGGFVAQRASHPLPTAP